MTDPARDPEAWMRDGWATIRSVQPPASLAENLRQGIRSTPQRRLGRRPRPGLLGLVAVLAITVVALGGIVLRGAPVASPAASAGGSVPSASLPLPPPDTGALGRLWTHDGEQVPFYVLGLQPGPGHCGWDGILFLTMSIQLGQRAETADDEFQYVRDPTNRWVAEPTDGSGWMTLGRFEPSVAKPADAVFTGYTYPDGMELWRSEAASNALIFLRRGDIWEQWPRSRTPIACM